MTVINIIAGFIYTEKGAIKDKIKLVAIALVFLVLLYNSPAGLVFYCGAAKGKPLYPLFGYVGSRG